VYVQFAKAREEQGQLAEAAAEYERAGDSAAAVRLLLAVGSADKAFATARSSGRPGAAALIVKHCVARSDWAGAVEFNVVAGNYAAAWQIAQTHSQMDTYAAAIGTGAPAATHAQVAVYFQNVKEHFKAACQYELAGNTLSAVSQFMAHVKKVRASRTHRLPRAARSRGGAPAQAPAHARAHAAACRCRPWRARRRRSARWRSFRVRRPTTRGAWHAWC
jgi:thioredoxin-like negative regulator of GroEL